MDKKQERIEKYAAIIKKQIFDIIINEDCENYLGDEDVDSTEFGMALMIANSSVIKNLFGEKEINLLTASHSLNYLAVEYLMRYGKILYKDQNE